MIIRFTSTMTAEHESRVASALAEALRHLLAPFPIAYAVRIETTAGHVIDDAGAGTSAWWRAPESPEDDPADGRQAAASSTL